MPLAGELLGVVGMAEHGPGKVWASNRFAGGAPGCQWGIVDGVAGVGEQGSHALGAHLAVLARAVQALEQAAVAVIDAVAEDVEVLIAAVHR